MALKRRQKNITQFQYGVYDRLIFLLLIFYDYLHHGVANAIKVLLPQGKQQTSAKPLTRVIIDKNLNFYTAFGNQDEMPIELEELPAFFARVRSEKSPICMWRSMRMRQCLIVK